MKLAQAGSGSGVVYCIGSIAARGSACFWEEMEFHIESMAQDLAAQGMPGTGYVPAGKHPVLIP